MALLNLCFIGFGNVGRNLAQLLLQKREVLKDQYGIEWNLTGVASRRLGWKACDKGLNVHHLLNHGVPDMAVPSFPSLEAWLETAKPDVLFEMSSLEPLTGQPAIRYIQAALQAKAHVVTANKGPVVHAYHELSNLAAAQNKRFLFEATFMGGVPIFSLFRETRPASCITKFRGILNNTTSIILEAIERGETFEDGIRHAQKLGVTETDPSADIDGWDAAVKVASLATVLMNRPMKLDEVKRQGIREIAPSEIQAAKAVGKRIRLVSQAELKGDRIEARVSPEILSLSDPLASIGSLSLLAQFETDTIRNLSISADDLGVDSTAYDMLADFILIAKTR